MTQEITQLSIKLIIGLGNPGKKYQYTRHNIGFRVVDQLVQGYGGTWSSKDIMEVAEIMIHNNRVMVVKPQTFMNDSGKVIPFFVKKGIKPENILVVHDELEKQFGTLRFKVGGSHRGHNGLRSIIARCGADFARLAFGIGRPERKEDVSDYVLSNFSESSAEVDALIDDAVVMIEQLFT